jgi:hypothetical protein
MPFKDPETLRLCRRKWEQYHAERSADRHLVPAKDRHPSRAGHAAAAGRFVSIDGEGYDPSENRHVYAWLSASNGERMETLYNPYGLSPRACWDFLLSLPETFGPSVYVGFSLGYDMEFWLPPNDDRVKMLDERGRCRYGPYRFLLWPRKRFEVGRVEGEEVAVRIDDVF